MRDLARYTFKTERQRVLAGMLIRDFAQYRKREQLYYELEGMSTSHITLHVLRDTSVLAEFWPYSKTTTWPITPMNIRDTIERIQDAVRATLDQLAKEHFIDKVGNEHERRWLLKKQIRKELQ